MLRCLKSNKTNWLLSCESDKPHDCIEVFKAIVLALVMSKARAVSLRFAWHLEVLHWMGLTSSQSESAQMNG